MLEVYPNLGEVARKKYLLFVRLYKKPLPMRFGHGKRRELSQFKSFFRFFIRQREWRHVEPRETLVVKTDTFANEKGGTDSAETHGM